MRTCEWIYNVLHLCSYAQADDFSSLLHDSVLSIAKESWPKTYFDQKL